MYNAVILIGRITDKPSIKTLENGHSVGNFTIVVNRPFKNLDGEYEQYFIQCTVWNGIAESMSEYCKKGSVIGVKGHLTTKDEKIINDKGEQISIKVPNIYVEKINFIHL